MNVNLWRRIHVQFEAAVISGHLFFAQSTVEVVEESGIKFHLRLAPSLAKKPTGMIKAAAAVPEESRKPPASVFNPFLTPDRELIIMEFDQHLLLLNKFSIVKGHVLVVTKEWQSQSDLIKSRDFQAAHSILCMTDDDGKSKEYIGFYNCGPESGAR